MKHFLNDVGFWSYLGSIAAGASMVCYGAQHGNAGLFGFGIVWAIGSFIRTLFIFA